MKNCQNLCLSLATGLAEILNTAPCCLDSWKALSCSDHIYEENIKMHVLIFFWTKQMKKNNFVLSEWHYWPKSCVGPAVPSLYSEQFDGDKGPWDKCLHSPHSCLPTTPEQGRNTGPIYSKVEIHLNTINHHVLFKFVLICHFAHYTHRNDKHVLFLKSNIMNIIHWNTAYFYWHGITYFHIPYLL